MIERLAVVGVGLLGGSVARGARARGLAREIVGVGRDAARLEPARGDGTLDRVATTLAAGLVGADMVVLATPVRVLREQLGDVARCVEPAAIVTDVGSTKQGVVDAAAGIARERPFRFVGSHPMAGSERGGYQAASADLFVDARVVLTPGPPSDATAVRAVRRLWEDLGAHVVDWEPAAHDRAAAAISHLPHLAAFALVEAAEQGEPRALTIAGRGYRDTTRIAAADAGVWTEIFLENAAPLAEILGTFRGALAELERAIADRDAERLRGMLDDIGKRRRALACA